MNYIFKTMWWGFLKNPILITISLLRFVHTGSKSIYLLISSVMKSNNNATWNIFIVFLPINSKQPTSYEQALLNIKMRTHLKWVFINKIKDVNKATKLSKVQAQDESGMILFNQAEFYQKNAYKHWKWQKNMQELNYIYERFYLFRFSTAEMTQIKTSFNYCM